NALLRAGASVLGWELDPAWAFHLRAVAPPGLDLVVGDALDVPWERLPAGSLVAGNLPYQVATRIVQDLVRSPAAWECAAFLVQLEVAERLVAAPRQRAYGSLSVLVQARARVRLLGTVKPGAFRPPPA